MTAAGRLSVLNVAYPLAEVGPDAVGGAEHVLSAVDHALVEAGHRSTVIACAGSVVRGTLVALPPPPAHVTQAARDAAHKAAREAITRVLATRRIDLVHMHGIDFMSYLPPPGPPVLVTLHLPPPWYPPGALHPTRPDTWLACVSWSQHRTCPPGPCLLPPVPNGVPVDALAGGRHARRGFALTLGRVCPEKGQHIALDAAHTAGVPLLVCGQVFPYPEHEAYFDAEVKPQLDRRRRFLGPVGFARKRRLLSAARCLLVPSLAPETSSLVAMEALACGTPVIAFASGALAEIVEPGMTGFLRKDTDGIVEAIRRCDEIHPATCRRVARERFSLRGMTDAYLSLYAKLGTAALQPAAFA